MIANGSGELRQWAVPDCGEAVRFYVRAFGGRELTRECLPDGHVVASEVAVGPYVLSLTEQPGAIDDETPVWARPGLPLGCADLERAALRVVTAGGDVEFISAGGSRAGSGIAVRDLIGRRWLLHQQDAAEALQPVPPPRPAPVEGVCDVAVTVS